MRGATVRTTLGSFLGGLPNISAVLMTFSDMMPASWRGDHNGLTSICTIPASSDLSVNEFTLIALPSYTLICSLL